MPFLRKSLPLRKTLFCVFVKKRHIAFSDNMPFRFFIHDNQNSREARIALFITTGISAKRKLCCYIRRPGRNRLICGMNVISSSVRIMHR